MSVTDRLYGYLIQTSTAVLEQPVYVIISPDYDPIPAGSLDSKQIAEQFPIATAFNNSSLTGDFRGAIDMSSIPYDEPFYYVNSAQLERLASALQENPGAILDVCLWTMSIAAVWEMVIKMQEKKFEQTHQESFPHKFRDKTLIRSLALTPKEIWENASRFSGLRASAGDLAAKMRNDCREALKRGGFARFGFPRYLCTRFVESQTISELSVWCGSEERATGFIRACKTAALRKVEN